MASNSTEVSIYFHLSGPFVNRFLRVGYFRTIIDVLSHVLLVAIMAMVAWACLRVKLRGSADHGLYTSLGLFFFVGWAQLLKCHSCWLANSGVGNILHGVLGGLALWSGGMGILAKTIQKRRMNKRFDIMSREGHMASKHARCGMLGYLLLMACVISGLVHLLTKTSVNKEILLLCHQIFGLSAFASLAISQWFSYGTVFARRVWSWWWIRIIQLATVSATVMVGYEELFHIADIFVRFLKRDF